MNQLDNFVRSIEALSRPFSELLSCCVSKNVIASEKIRKMIIWPKAKKTGKKSIEELTIDEGIDVIEYDWDHISDINSIKFSAYYSKR